jgi:hypothetical protein
MSGAPVKIDTSQVPPEKLDHSDFLKLHAQIAQALANQKWRFAFSVHETGHLIYLTRAGFKDFLYLGPRIVYDAEKDEFNGFPAAVQPQFGKIDAPDFELDKWILDVANGYAAAGVFAHELTAAPDVGDEQDRQNFEAFCDLVLQHATQHATNLSIDRIATWKQAEDAVRKDLRSPAFRKEVWQKAAEVRERLFGHS